MGIIDKNKMIHVEGTKNQHLTIEDYNGKWTLKHVNVNEKGEAWASWCHQSFRNGPSEKRQIHGAYLGETDTALGILAWAITQITGKDVEALTQALQRVVEGVMGPVDIIIEPRDNSDVPF